MVGDVVQMAVEIGGGTFDSGAVLNWLANIVRTLRTEESAACGPAGTFSTTEQIGTVEINPSSRLPHGGRPRRTLVFDASPGLSAVLAHHALTEDVLKGLEDDDEISQAFARALAEALVHHGRAAIGNFGVWTVGQKPNLQRFIRFRSRPAINQML